MRNPTPAATPEPGPGPLLPCPQSCLSSFLLHATTSHVPKLTLGPLEPMGDGDSASGTLEAIPPLGPSARAGVS